jgi:probable phosphoglycerate mutase
MRTRFFIVRHPETTANADGRYIGRGDAPYTELGLEQARLLSDEIVSARPDRVVASPLRRTRDVGLSAAQELSMRLGIDERLTELDFGEVEGLTLAEVRASLIAFDFHNADAPVAPGGESRSDIFRRSAQFAKEQIDLGGRVAVVTHGGVFRSLVVFLLDLPLDAIWAFDIRPAQICEILVVEDRGIMVSFRRPLGESVIVSPDEPAAR